VQSNIDISKFENKRVIVVGDIMLDEFVYTTSNRKSPEHKDVPVLHIQEKKQYLGGAANVALNIKKLKAIPYLIGTVGNDEAGQTVYNLLHQEDITNLYVHTNHRQKTTIKSRIFQDKNPVFRIDIEDKNEYPELVNHFILKNIQSAITNHKPHVIILQDYNKGVLNATIIPEILTLAKQHRILVCVDPKFDNWNLYKDVDLFKPNLYEFGMMIDYVASHCMRQTNLVSTENAILLQQKINYKNLLVTLGADGNFIFDGKKSQILNLKSPISSPDVCGAGDTVIAVASLSLACGFSLEDIAALSNKAGYIVCQKEHVQPVTLDELENVTANEVNQSHT
jgi:rfaE bifunctional protein kinase chain/domain